MNGLPRGLERMANQKGGSGQRQLLDFRRGQQYDLEFSTSKGRFQYQMEKWGFAFLNLERSCPKWSLGFQGFQFVVAQ